HPQRSMQTSATVDADIRNGRRRHPQRPTLMLVTVDADAFLTTSTPQHLNIKSHHLTIKQRQG
ncbi:hypothetical protein, partial [Leyella stercorea]|uniref:hypothetical protein n=1 Tax=Leyella stercorea TaxID=363265 RepID=UPI003FEF8785